MAVNGPIIIIEDDEDDQEIIKQVMEELEVKNTILFFTSCLPALLYLKETTDSPFIILCDVNLPIKSGIEFKKDIDKDPELRRRSIPFIFYSTSDDQPTIDYAYTQLAVQGFFRKEAKLKNIHEVVGVILSYWKHCLHPNT
jgi:CheY-like chemotaxis protein